MLNPSAERELTENYRLSTEKARQWWRNQAFESRKNIVIESDAVINDDQEVEDQIVADVADSDYDELPDETKQEIDVQIDEEEDIEEIFEVQGEEYLQCSKCDDLFTSNEDYDIHKSVDHGEEPEDFEDSEETYQLTMNPDLTRESLREANSLLTETEEKELYGGYDKTGKIQSSVMPYNVPAKATGKYNDNPNEFFYSNKIFRAGNSSLRTASLGESKASENWEDLESVWNQYFEQVGTDNNHVGWINFAQSKGANMGDAELKWNYENDKSYQFHSEARATEEFDISKYYKEVTEDGWMDYQCNSCGKKIDPDDGYGDQKDYGVLIQELKDHQINHKFVYESKATEIDGWNMHLTDEFEMNPILKDWIRKTGLDWDNSLPENVKIDAVKQYQNGVNAEDYKPYSYESKASEGQVDYEDDGVSDISVPNAEPKGEDKNEFLDDVDISEEAVDYVYPTKATESTKSYITESEPFDEEYEEFEDSDDEMIEETISIRKLTGYSDNSIAQELHINYGVSHEEALEKVYSVEVSTNDKVAQTFFGKMFKECTESEKDELRMYSGSD